MNLQQKIIIELQKNELPDFDFLFSPEALEVALEVLKELLNNEKQNFNKIVEKKNQDVVFDDFITRKDYSYFFEIIQFGKLISGKKEFNSIIEEFEPILTDFNNSCLFNNDYYEKMKYALSHLSLSSDQKRILELRIKKYEHNGVHKDLETKKQLNTINIELTKLSNRFQNNTIQSKTHFFLHFENAFSLK
jgi:Zn-dependent oligopeptidase